MGSVGYGVVVPELRGYVWTRMLDDVRDVVAYGLRGLGYEVELRNTAGSGRNIVICPHLIPLWVMDSYPADTVILNTEQLGSGNEWNATLVEWGKRFEVWEYSDRNIVAWGKLGVKARKFRFGYCPELQRISPSPDKDCEVLFYGMMNPRRGRLLQGCVDRGLRLRVLQGVFGAERDQQIARSELVLNIHYYEDKIFEIVRCFYLMINRVPIVAEVDADTDIDAVYQRGVYGVPYDRLIDAAIELRDNAELRTKVAQAGYDSIRSVDMATELRQLLF